VSKVTAGIDRPELGRTDLRVDFKDADLIITESLRKQRRPLVLILDEAQSLGAPKAFLAEMESVVLAVLKDIHNGDIGKPIMLIASELATTKSLLSRLSVSRVEGDCDIRLARFDKKSERVVIIDWLTQPME